MNGLTQTHARNSFQDHSCTGANVDAAMHMLGLEPEAYKSLKNFVTFSLMNLSRMKDDGHDEAADAALKRVRGYWRFAIKLRHPYYARTDDMPETLLAAVAMLALPPKMCGQGMQILSSTSFRPMGVGARCVFDACAMFETELPESAARYGKLDRQEKLLFDLYAAMNARALSNPELSPARRIEMTNAAARHAGVITTRHGNLAAVFLGTLSHAAASAPSLRRFGPTPAGQAKVHVFSGFAGGRRPS